MNELPNLEMIAAAVVAVVVTLIVIYAAIRSGRRATEERGEYLLMGREHHPELYAEILLSTWEYCGYEADGYLSVNWNGAGLLTITTVRNTPPPPHLPTAVTRQVYCYKLRHPAEMVDLLIGMHHEMMGPRLSI